MEIKLTDEALTKVVDRTADTLDKTAHPIAKTLGDGLSDLLSIVFYPIRLGKGKLDVLYGSKIEEFEKELKQKSDSIPQEKKLKPNPSFIMRTLENSKYCITEDELRSKFVNLIGSSLNSDLVAYCHPSFSDIIKQMSTIDAIVINSFSSANAQPILDINYMFPNEPNSNEIKFNVINNCYYILDELSDYSQDYLDFSISNLIRLGLLTADHTHFLTSDNCYDNIMTCAKNYIETLIQDGLTSIIDNFDKSNIDYNKGNITLTDLGKKFIKVCC